MPENKLVDRNAQLNPQIAVASIGVRNLRDIKIYPLSMADQLEMTDILTAGMQEFVLRGDMEDIAFVGAIVELIKKNLAKILKMVSDEDGDELLKDLTNPQAMEIAELIFDMNFGSLGKNVQSLAQKIRKLSQSARQSPVLSKSTEDTDSKTSSENPSETEASQ